MYAFLGWREFYKHLRAWRLVFFRGAFGTGKTLLSVALAYHMIRLGKIASASFCFPVRWAAVPSPFNSFNVLDEAGRLFEDRTAYKDKALNHLSKEATWALRKDDSYLLLPSVIPVDRRLRRGVRIWRVWPPGESERPNWLQRSVWRYVWEAGSEDREIRQEGVDYWHGQLTLLNPGYFFGMYDTTYKPDFELLRDFIGRCVAVSD
jgi:hypothetical protein